jgi:hypothetical protein
MPLLRHRSRPDPSSPAAPGAPTPDLALTDNCVRCGRPTPQGVSLCEYDNPGRISSPSTTQVHGTVAIGIISGFVILAVAARVALTGVGPFEADLVQRVPQADGSVALSVRVQNSGSKEAAAACRVTRGGITGTDDLLFLTDSIPVGATKTYERRLGPPDPGNTAWVLDRLAVACR